MQLRRTFPLALAVALVSVPVAAETLYNQHGVRLSATVQEIETGAAVCRVREERHTAEQYEKLKPNDGRPLDVWRVELVVANYSGRVLDYVSAHLNVESSWPPCDHWDGPESRYGKAVVWTGPLMTISDVGSVLPGEERREVEFVLAWHEDDPVLGRWDIDYDFGEAAPVAAERAAAGASTGPGNTAASRSDGAAGIARADPPAARPSRQPGDTFRDTLASGGSGPEMVVIPAGSFRMGCVSGVGCYNEEKPVHQVRIPRPFAVGKYQVTFAEWDACVSAGGCSHRPNDEGWGRGRRPVLNVTWEDAREYVRWLSEQTGAEYRLLSEAGWEYAARAGSVTAYSWGNEVGSGRANCDGCGSQWDGRQTAPVGSFGANAFGLHDMHGNVLEWVEDCWNGNYNGAPSNGGAWRSGECFLRVLRGTSWRGGLEVLGSANRTGEFSDERRNFIGFRVARTLNP